LLNVLPVQAPWSPDKGLSLNSTGAWPPLNMYACDPCSPWHYRSHCIYKLLLWCVILVLIARHMDSTDVWTTCHRVLNPCHTNVLYRLLGPCHSWKIFMQKSLFKVNYCNLLKKVNAAWCKNSFFVNNGSRIADMHIVYRNLWVTNTTFTMLLTKAQLLKLDQYMGNWLLKATLQKISHITWALFT